MLESEFKDRHVIPWLRSITCYFFVKEAVAIRGIPDIIGCYKGMFFALELKRCKLDANKKTGRIVQQRYNLSLIHSNQGFAAIVYPENFEEVKLRFSSSCQPSVMQ